MTMNSPRPEQAQLNIPIKIKSNNNTANKKDFYFNALTQELKSNTTSNHISPISSNNTSPIINNNNTLQFDYSNDQSSDDHLIPSPPLSPKFFHINDSNLIALDHINDTSNTILVKNVWDNTLTPRNYRRATHHFLSNYHISNNINNNIRYLENPALSFLKKTNNNNNSYITSSAGSEYERPRRLTTNSRRSNHRNDYIFSENEDSSIIKRTNHNIVHKVKRNHNSSNSSSSSSAVLASQSFLNGVTQYVPHVSWEKLPDYSPSTVSIPMDNTRCLKVEWKGSPMSLINDPLKDKLHPSELVLAQILRLPCDLYLDSKRRLFLEKVCRFKKGLPFRRTDAQKACRIDVNKASRLYAAYEKIGWLNDSNFVQFL